MEKVQSSSRKITPFLWFNNNAEEAVTFYTSIFKDSSVGSITRNGGEGPGPKGTAMVVSFRLYEQEFIALNGGPQFTFTEAVSFVVNCETQDEVDEFWTKLSEGGTTSQCGWLKDKFGLSWQIVPTVLSKLMSSKDAARSKRVMQAMMQMTKMDIAKLEQAYAGQEAPQETVAGTLS